MINSIKSSDEARLAFVPLTYSDLQEYDIMKLVAILERHLGLWNEQVINYRMGNEHDNRYVMVISYKDLKIRINRTDKHSFEKASIKVICDGYTKREGITFNSNGFIGFAGWADSDNVRPFLNAFEEWIIWEKKKQEVFRQLEIINA